MIRPVTIATFLLACGSGLYLYQEKHEVQVLDRTIERTVKDTGALREQSRLLAAEWTMLNDPVRLQQFSEMFASSMKPIDPKQFTSLADLDKRLPSVPVEPPPVVDDTIAETAAPPPPVVAEQAPPATAPAIEPPPVPTPAPPPALASAPKSPERKIFATKPPDAAQPRAVAAEPPRAVAAETPRPAVTEPSRAAGVSEPTRAVVIAEPPRVARPTPAPQPPVQPPVQARYAATTRPPLPAPSNAYAASPPPIQPPPYTGSLLGMAHTAPPAPRPVPVNATNWYNQN